MDITFSSRQPYGSELEPSAKLLWVVNSPAINHQGTLHVLNEDFWFKLFKLLPLRYDDATLSIF